MAALTTIATAAALAATAAQTTGSFIQARKFKKQQQEADRKADEALAAAKKDISKNYLAGLSYAKEPYELAREAINVGLAQQTQAGVEGETRGAAATAGKAQIASIGGQRQLAMAEAEDIYGLQKLAAQEEARLAGLSYNLNLAELFGQQAASQVAEANRQAQIQAGIEGVGELVKQAGANVRLAQQTQAGVEGETRGAAATAGKAQIASIGGQRQLAMAEAEDIYGLQKLAAQEEARLAGLSYNLNLTELFGQQAASQVAEANRQAQIQTGIKGVGEVVKQGGAMIPEYMATPEGRAVNKLERQFNRAQRRGEITGDVSIGEFGNLNPITTYLPGYDSNLAQSYGDFYTDDFASVSYSQNPLDFFSGMTPFEIREYFSNRR